MASMAKPYNGLYIIDVAPEKKKEFDNLKVSKEFMDECMETYKKYSRYTDKDK